MPAPQAKTPSTTTPSASPATTASAGRTPAIPAAHTPTPAQQAPNVRKPLAPYIPEANPNAPPDPVRALADRQREAINSRLKDGQRTAVQASGVDTSTSGSPKTSSPTSSASQTKGSQALDSLSKEAAPEAKATGSDSSEPEKESSVSTPDSDTSAATEASSTSAARGPRYDVKTMKKWAEENPEKAAELATQVFGLNQDAKTEYIRIQNKKRKVRGEIREEREKTLSAVTAEKTAAKAEADRVETHRKAVQPLVDLFQGGAKKNGRGEWDPDFDAVDAAFEQCTQGLSLDAYMRMRARRGIANPEQARIRAENARLERENAELRAKGTPAEAPKEGEKPAPAAKPAIPAPTAAELAEKWGEEVPKKHPLRKLDGWAQDLEDAMSAYHDEELDEYSRDPEEVANEVLKAKLKELAGDDEDEEEPAPAPRARPRVKVKGKTPAVGKDGLPDPSSLRPRTPNSSRAAPAEDDDEPADFKSRERRAFERHQMRIRGELKE